MAASLFALPARAEVSPSCASDDKAAGCPAPRAQEKIIDLVFVLDTTGSMSSLIDGAKRKIWSIANTVIDRNPAARIRMGLVGYRDIGDEYVTRVHPLTEDIQGLYAKLLAFQANGGGDTPESVNEALAVAVDQQPWTQGEASRILFLVGDAPPHMDYPQDRKYPATLKIAREKGIVVNTVQAGEHGQTRRYWQDIAQQGGGQYVAIPQDGGRIVIIETPYDQDILILQGRINATIVPYGRAEQQESTLDKAKSYRAAPSASIAAEMSSFVNKSGKGKAAVTGAGDMVADIAEGRVNLADIPKQELPAPLQNMAAEDKKAYLAARGEERDQLSRQLAEKIRQRDAWLRDDAARTMGEKGKGDSFDQAVSRALEAQIGR
jgi:hypothetical protein